MPVGLSTIPIVGDRGKLASASTGGSSSGGP